MVVPANNPPPWYASWTEEGRWAVLTEGVQPTTAGRNCPWTAAEVLKPEAAMDEGAVTLATGGGLIPANCPLTAAVGSAAAVDGSTSMLVAG